MTKKIPTVRRAKWHRKCDRWQVQNADGRLCSIAVQSEPWHVSNGYWYACPISVARFWKHGPKRKPPKDHTKTLRRIVDRPKRHCFIDDSRGDCARFGNGPMHKLHSKGGRK